MLARTARVVSRSASFKSANNVPQACKRMGASARSVQPAQLSRRHAQVAQRCMGTFSGKKIALTRNIPPQGMELLKKAQDEGLEVQHWAKDDPIPHKLLAEWVGKGDLDGLLCLLTEPITAPLLKSAGDRLKVVSTMSVGYNHIDYEACNSMGIKIGFTPGVLTETTADLAVTLMLSTARRITEASEAVKNGEWVTWKPMWLCGPDMHHSTVGIIGFGRIGQAVAKRLQGFGCKIIYSDAHKQDFAGAEHKSLDEVLAESDFVLTQAALTPETHKMMSTEQFKKMKKSAVFVNVARGEIVDQDALAEALKTGEIRAAGIDVCDPEPIAMDSPLLKLKNCIVLPHIGSASDATRGKMASMSVENVLAGISGKPIPNTPFP